VGGVITDSMVAYKGRDEEHGGTFFVWFMTRPHWDITVVFTYVVEGVQQAGEQRWYTGVNDKAGAQEELHSYPVGQAVTVKHNPENPAKAVIEVEKPTKRESDVKFVAAGVGALLGGFGTWILAERLLG